MLTINKIFYHIYLIAFIPFFQMDIGELSLLECDHDTTSKCLQVIVQEKRNFTRDRWC